MQTEIKLPKLGFSMGELTLNKWYVQEGEEVGQGQPIAEIEGEKITTDLEAPASGILTKHCMEEGDEGEIGAVVAILETE